MAVNVQKEWRCAQCGKLMALMNAGRVHIRLGKGSEFYVGLPVTGKCPRCGALNEILTGSEGTELASSL